MSRFNKTNISTRVVNKAGGEAFAESPKLALVSLLLTSFLQDQYYRSTDESLSDLTNLIDKIPYKFVAKAAIYARNEFGMRSITHALAGELATRIKGEKWAKEFFDKIIHRPDDMTEIMAYYFNISGKNGPTAAMRKGFQKALTRFDEYQLAKYKEEKKEISLYDVVNMVHPKPTEALTALMKGTIKPAETWEVGLTQAGEDEVKKKEVWKKLIFERKIGYFALLRNLRNIIEQAPEVLDKALELLTDEKLIKKSLVLPFRFLTAVQAIEELEGVEARKTLVALNKAVDISLSNVPKFEGETLVVLDTSGSMAGGPIEIGSLFASIMIKTNNCDFMIFSDDAKYLSLNPLDSTLTIANRIKENVQGGGTNFHSIFETANRPYKRIIIFSDMQGWIGYYSPTKTFAEYKTRVGANPYIYSWDLQGYGTLQFPEKNVFCLAGFSEKVFNFMKLIEQDRNILISKIEEVEI